MSKDDDKTKCSVIGVVNKDLSFKAKDLTSEHVQGECSVESSLEFRVLTKGQAVARIADRTASQQTQLLISDCC